MNQKNNEISSIRTVGAFLNKRACSDTLFHMINRAYNNSKRPEEQAAMLLAGGIMQHGYQCGMIWGAALAAGAQAYRVYGTGAAAEEKAINAARKIVESFRAQNNSINCLEITEIDKSSSTRDMIMYFLVKGGTIGCFKRAARYAPAALIAINSTFSETPIKEPDSQVSCAAILAKIIGLSDEHTTMVSGFAGGIGLCGGACGALGAAIWIIGLKSMKENNNKVDFKDPLAIETIERFIKTTDFKFECREITGQTFENISDHSAYLCKGGCSEIIEILAESVKNIKGMS